MIFSIAKFIAGLFGWDISKVQRWVFFSLVVLLSIAALVIGLWISRLFHHAPKLNEKQITAAQQAIATNDREQMTKILVDSDVAEKQIDANVAYSNTQTTNAQAESRQKWSQASNEEMQAELERRAREP